MEELFTEVADHELFRMSRRHLDFHLFANCMPIQIKLMAKLQLGH